VASHGTGGDRVENLAVLTSRHAVRLEAISCHALCDDPGACSSAGCRRRSRAMVVWSTQRSAEVMFSDRVVVEGALRLDIRQRLSIELVRGIPSRVLRQSVGSLDVFIQPAIYELVALFSRRFGMTPVLLPVDGHGARFRFSAGPAAAPAQAPEQDVEDR
jgi:hypothetical protein